MQQRVKIKYIKKELVKKRRSGAERHRSHSCINITFLDEKMRKFIAVVLCFAMQSNGHKIDMDHQISRWSAGSLDVTHRGERKETHTIRLRAERMRLLCSFSHSWWAHFCFSIKWFMNVHPKTCSCTDWKHPQTVFLTGWWRFAIGNQKRF